MDIAAKSTEDKPVENSENDNAKVSPNDAAFKECYEYETDITVLLLEDSKLEKLPQHFEKILKNFDRQQATQSDLLIALVYCIALETGFVSASTQNAENFDAFWGYTFNSKNLKRLSTDSRNFYSSPDENIYHIDLLLLNLSEIVCVLMIIKSGDCFVLTLTPTGYPGMSVCLSIPRYVLSIKNKEFSYRFRNLKELTFLLRGKMFVPTRNLLIDELWNFYPGLSGLPTELLLYIFRYLNAKNLHILSKSCRRLRLECAAEYNKRQQRKR